MSEIYFRHFRKMQNWQRVKMWTEKKLLRPHKHFGIFKMFDSELNGFNPITGDKTPKEIDRIGCFSSCNIRFSSFGSRSLKSMTCKFKLSSL